jgi:aspartyl-tRNA(Asn)/glutamyl-tRNA(Gln) amidotransferase subunit A
MIPATAGASFGSERKRMNDWATELSLGQLVAGYRARAFTPIEAVECLADLIQAVDGELNAFAHICLDDARSRARDATRRLTRGHLRPVEGVPFAVKDLLDTAGVPTECGSRLCAGRVPERDAAAVARLTRAGAILIGKTTTHEFGWGITTTSEGGRPTRNPWSLDRIAGGSSGGSAVAVADGLVPLALGTDTAGSIRIPADFCGVVGLRPTRDTVPRGGAFALAPSLDAVGLMTREPADAAVALGVLIGRTARTPWRASGDLSGSRIGVVAGLSSQLVRPDRRAALAASAAVAERLGAEVVEVADDAWTHGLDPMATIVLAEGLLTHRRRGLWPRGRLEYGPDVRRHLERAEALPHGAYQDAVATAARLGDDVASTFAHVDVVLSLSSGTAAAGVDVDPSDGDFRRRVMTFTAPQSLAGLPACTVRAGFDADGLPIGVQLTGRPGADLAVLEVAHELHAATADIQRVRPAMGGRTSVLPAEAC